MPPTGDPASGSEAEPAYRLSKQVSCWQLLFGSCGQPPFCFVPVLFPGSFRASATFPKLEREHCDIRVGYCWRLLRRMFWLLYGLFDCQSRFCRFFCHSLLLLCESVDALIVAHVTGYRKPVIQTRLRRDAIA